jgi:hypothetical protein
MPLTMELKDPRSPVRGFIHDRFPNSRAVLQPANDELAQAVTIRPPERVPYSTVGMALDYRLRYYFGITLSRQLTAFRGAAWDIRPGSPADGFFAGLDDTVQRMQPVDRRLDPLQESQLAKCCHVLALFEERYRRGRSIRSPLRDLPSEGGPECLLAILPFAAVDDLCALSWAFYDNFTDLIGGAREVVLNPSFDGSRDVRGADADVLLDGCLLEFKCSVTPKIRTLALYQLLGYVLLDYSDRHRIRSVGVYMARQQVLFRWPLAELLCTMAGSPAPDLADIRAQFRKVVEEARVNRSAPTVPMKATETTRSAAISRWELAKYANIIDSVRGRGGAGAILRLEEGESERTAKFRLFMAARQRGLNLRWEKSRPGELRLVLIPRDEQP